MPALSLVVCLKDQRDLLERLVRESKGCFDELVVVHDIPDSTGVRGVVEGAGGRFFERPPPGMQEPHWPFAWQQAAHDWILRLDADEYPSEELKEWLRKFRTLPEPSEAISGYTCIWPLWDGHKAVSRRWPRGRNFLFHRHRVRFFGMPEQVPVPDGRFEPLELVLRHEPKRKSYGLWNMLVRSQSRRGQAFIARSLLGKPTDLVCWRWESEEWPWFWEQVRRHPFRTALYGLTRGTLSGLRHQWRAEKRFFPVAAISGPIWHAYLCLGAWQTRRRQASGKSPERP